MPAGHARHDPRCSRVLRTVLQGHAPGHAGRDHGAPTCNYCTAGAACNATAAKSAAVCKPCGYDSFSSQGAPACSTCPGNRAAAGATCPAGSRRQNTRVDCACANCPAGGLAPPEHAGQLRVRQLPGQRACTPRRARRAAAPAAAGAPSTRTAYSAHAGFSQSCMRRSPGKEGTPQSG